MRAYITDDESRTVIQSALPRVEHELEKLFNLDGFELIMVKEQDGQFVPCSEEESLERLNNKVDNGCISFEDIGMSKRLMQGLLGLAPYQRGEVKLAISQPAEMKLPDIQIYMKEEQGSYLLRIGNLDMDPSFLDIQFDASSVSSNFQNITGDPDYTMPISLSQLADLCSNPGYTYLGNSGTILQLANELPLGQASICSNQGA